MIIMFDNIIESVSATNEDSSFPADNVLEAHSRKRFRAGAISTELTLTMGGGSNALCLYNLTADSVTATITGVLDETLDLTRDDGWGAYNATCCLFEYTLQSTTHTCTISLSATSNDVACGIAFGGRAYEFTNPQWGLSNAGKSHSIIYDLDNGYEYIFQRNYSKMPGFDFKLTNRVQYWNLLRLCKECYPNPIVVKTDDMGSDETHNLIWYGRIDGEPKGTLTSFNSYKVSFGLKEFL